MNSTIKEETIYSANQFRLLRQVFSIISQGIELNKILEAIVNEVGIHYKLDRCQIIKCNTNIFRSNFGINLESHLRNKSLQIAKKPSILVDALIEYRRNKSITPTKTEELPIKIIYHYFENLISQREQNQTEQLKILLNNEYNTWNNIVPIRYKGQPYGILWLHKNSPNPLSTGDLNLLSDIAGYIGQAIHNRKLLIREIQAKRKAEENNLQQNLQFASIAHELRTPLNTIIAGASLLSEGAFGNVNPKQKQYASLIEGQGSHLLTMINNLLDFSKLESGKTKLNISQINTSHFVKTISTIIEPLLQQKQQTLNLIIDPNTPIVFEGDETRLKQIFFNLISNAHKFSPSHSEITFSCSLSKSNISNQLPRLVFTVADRGIGIQEADQKRIFQPYEQVANSNIKGTGLGLSITQSFIKLHHGHIDLVSEINKGSVFIVTIPQVQPQSSPINSTLPNKTKSIR